MTHDMAFEILDKFHRCDACESTDSSFSCNDCDEAFYMALQLLKDKKPRLLTVEEVRDHYAVPVSKLQLQRYNDYAEDIKPLYFEFPNNDGYEVHWRGYDKVSEYLRKRINDYGRTWRCWTDKPTDEQSKAEPWKDGEQE